MPGVDAREQQNAAEPIVAAGPTYRLRVARRGLALHIAETRHATVALCGARDMECDLVDAAGLKTVCQACRAVASRDCAKVIR